MTVTENGTPATNAAPASTQSDETTAIPSEFPRVIAAQGGTSTPEEQQSGSEGQNAGLIEARDRYRGERDSAREQLATAQARIEALQRSDIERVAAETMAQGADLWLNGNDVSSYLNDQGHVDYDRVREDAKLLIGERPGLSKTRPMIDPFQGLGGSTPMPKRVPTLSDLLKS